MDVGLGKRLTNVHEVYEKTALTPMRVARTSGYIDWAAQPRIFKKFPSFLFRYHFGSNRAFELIALSRSITARQKIAGQPYYRLNTPSAGNLHPTELYVQIRGLKGVLSGIYHVDAGTDELVLIREIEADGLEPTLGLKGRLEGMIFIVSSVPFRSEWKYGERSVRYCYLDVGHQVGAVVAAARVEGEDATILSGFEVHHLNYVMGFKEEEFCCAAVAVGNSKNKKTKAIKTPLMQVSPTDYCDSNGYVSGVISHNAVEKSHIFPRSCSYDREAIKRRRSARSFSREEMGKEKVEYFMHLFAQAPYPLNAYSVILEKGIGRPGVYHNTQMLKEGEYAEQISALLVGQHFVKDAAMVLVLTSKKFSASILISAGAFVHQLYLDAQTKEMGFTGIGAFYDKQLQVFLGISEYVLYVCAIGKERK